MVSSPLSVAKKTIAVREIIPPAMDEHTEIADEALILDARRGRKWYSRRGSVCPAVRASTAYASGTVHPLSLSQRWRVSFIARFRTPG
ncbi:MAG TPA: hypothetical protein PKM43_09650 [Verrucomicrobiota bacterium]|nr:hypothetical protein [Verrucomicrobiota bacterium]HRZ56501.1 hypothetical protein [Candidatus Paceibacterota bacterium]